MGLPYLRLWDNILDRAKVMALPPTLFRYWIVTLLVTLRYGNAPLLPLLPDLAFSLRTTPEETQSIVDDLVKSGLIEFDGTHYQVHDWRHWQSGPASNADRQKRYRDKQRYALRNGDVTRVTTERSASAQPSAQEKEKTAPLLSPLILPPISPPEKRKRNPPVPPTIPDWIPRQDWDDYLDMRLRIKKPATERAKELAIAKLSRLREQGHAPGDVLQQSILGSHQGLFPVGYGNQPKNGFHQAPTLPFKSEPLEYFQVPPEARRKPEPKP